MGYSAGNDGPNVSRKLLRVSVMPIRDCYSIPTMFAFCPEANEWRNTAPDEAYDTDVPLMHRRKLRSGDGPIVL